ncbi:hypothetical protein K7432_007038 [Basidiobolus ranarum]|uniref:O-methyltransferase n=1 Tax=Basidiobolus ranarum TaxID=34480 RepID=A0ABR2WTZ9_9FUNG
MEYLREILINTKETCQLCYSFFQAFWSRQPFAFEFHLLPKALKAISYRVTLFLLWLIRHISPPAYFVELETSAFLRSKALYIACKLRVADVLENGPLDINTLANRVNSNTKPMLRLMRALAGFGLFNENTLNGNLIYSNNRHSRLLLSSNPKTLLYYILHKGNESYAASVDLDKMFNIENKGQTAFNSYFKTDRKYWDWLEEIENKDNLDIFGNAMVSIANWKGKIIATEFNWSQFSHKLLIDVGGGFGGVLKSILEVHPQIRATIFDREAVISLSRQEWAVRNHHISENVTFVAGDFFKSVPSNGDAYLLCTILHDWDDLSCIKILRTIKKCMTKPHARLFVLEMMVTSPMTDMAVAYSDLQMMMMVDGKERTPKELAYLFQKSGFSIHNIHHLSKGYGLIEAALP